MSSANRSSGGGTCSSAERRSAPVRRRAGLISATTWFPRVIVTVSPRSIASRRSEKLRDASVAVIVRIRPCYLIIRLAPQPRQGVHWAEYAALGDFLVPNRDLLTDNANGGRPVRRRDRHDHPADGHRSRFQPPDGSQQLPVAAAVLESTGRRHRRRDMGGVGALRATCLGQALRYQAFQYASSTTCPRPGYPGMELHQNRVIKPGSSNGSPSRVLQAQHSRVTVDASREIAHADLSVQLQLHWAPRRPEPPEHGLACIYIQLSTDRQTALVEVQDGSVKLPKPTSLAWMTKTVRTGPAPHTPLQ
jgi:hypothetical protein